MKKEGGFTKKHEVWRVNHVHRQKKQADRMSKEGCRRTKKEESGRTKKEASKKKKGKIRKKKDGRRKVIGEYLSFVLSPRRDVQTTRVSLRFTTTRAIFPFRGNPPLCPPSIPLFPAPFGYGAGFFAEYRKNSQAQSQT